MSLHDLFVMVREVREAECLALEARSLPSQARCSDLRDPQPRAARPKHSSFKSCAPGHIPIGVKYLPPMADGAAQRCLFVAADCAARWALISVLKAKTAANAQRFLRDLERACTSQQYKT